MTPIYPSETPRRRRHGAVFIGTYPGLTPAMLDYMIESITRFVRSK
jgi:hypothetical protein